MFTDQDNFSLIMHKEIAPPKSVYLLKSLELPSYNDNPKFAQQISVFIEPQTKTLCFINSPKNNPPNPEKLLEEAQQNFSKLSQEEAALDKLDSPYTQQLKPLHQSISSIQESHDLSTLYKNRKKYHQEAKKFPQISTYLKQFELAATYDWLSSQENLKPQTIDKAKLILHSFVAEKGNKAKLPTKTKLPPQIKFHSQSLNKSATILSNKT